MGKHGASREREKQGREGESFEGGDSLRVIWAGPGPVEKVRR